jgi:uncharacterized protein YodC (DUF2158 family)
MLDDKRPPHTLFTIGDVVKLQSGGPNMTISSIAGDHPANIEVTCQWFVADDVREAIFHAYTLIPSGYNP